MRDTTFFLCMFSNMYLLSLLSEKLSMKQDEAERWIVNLIRNARLVLIFSLCQKHPQSV
jgi:hypothetical protein